MKTSNELIAEFMGLCWHEFKDDEDGTYHCEKCNYRPTCVPAEAINRLPDYTSPDSPRRLLDEAEAKCIEVAGIDVYGRALTEIAFQNGVNSDTEHAAFLITATPAQRVAAIIAAIGGEKDA